MARGQITDKIQEIAKQYLGREITTTELRLYPYIDYCVKNSGYIDSLKMNNEERAILLSYSPSQVEWIDAGCILISKDFYDYMQRVLWESYVETKIKEEKS